MKKICILVLTIVLLFTLTACGVDKTTDAYRFKEEYESLNGEENDSGKKYRELEIPEENPIVYATAEEIVEKIDEKETFVVYFGFSKCPWCRSVIEQLIKSAQDNDIDKVYYVDVLEIRDLYELDEDNNPKRVEEGSKGYLDLIEKMKDVLDDYTLTNEEDEIKVGEKRIYAPNVVAVVNGVAEKKVEGISKDLKDPYDELTDDMREETYNSFKCLWECMAKGSNVCRKNVC